MTETQARAASNFVGHNAKWRALQRAFLRGQTPQTLLISGEANIGKWTLAHRLAQLLLCPNSMENLDENDLPAPCLKCRICHQVEIETFPDFRVYRPTVSAATDSNPRPPRAPEALDSSIISLKGEYGARRFFDEALYQPTIGKRKVMVLQQADRMNEQAQNALLKTFEEPAAGLTILLLSDSPLRLRETIRSRCWELRLSLAPEAEIRSWLQSEFSEVPPAAIEGALILAGGRAGRAHREIVRWQTMAQSSVVPTSRLEEVAQLIARVEKGSPVAALGLTEDALSLAETWGEEDQINRVRDAHETDAAPLNAAEEKKLARTLVRSQVTRFLDELSGGYRARWRKSLEAADNERARVWASGLDQIRKTRHYILRNANTNLALDVLFGRLIAEHHLPTRPISADAPAVPRTRPRDAIR